MSANRAKRRQAWKQSWKDNFVAKSGWILPREVRRLAWKDSWVRFKVGDEVSAN